MTLGLLASGENWHARDLLRAASLLGVALKPVEFTSLAANLGCRPIVAGGGGDLAAFQGILVRSMPAGSLEQVIFRMDALHRLEAAGVRVINRPRALEGAIDKYLSTARLEAAGLPVPPTSACARASDALEALARLGGDVVLKPLFGSEGRGLRRVTNLTEAAPLFAELESSGAVIYLQRFIEHPGYDFRLLTLGASVLGGIRRVAGGGWITNIARGGRAEPLEPTAELSALALRAAEVMGADIAGVDILPDKQGRLWVLEVNAVPGWRALAPATGIDVAVELIEYARKNAGVGLGGPRDGQEHAAAIGRAHDGA